uniref:Uncharacterized protein n=1 Tax=Anguilla anguilla TaxID=7936 RepID=A0A0E9SJP7_ANGAN
MWKVSRATMSDSTDRAKVNPKHAQRPMYQRRLSMKGDIRWM